MRSLQGPPSSLRTHVVIEAHVHSAVQHDILAPDGDQDAASAHVLAGSWAGRWGEVLPPPSRFPVSASLPLQVTAPATCLRPPLRTLGPWPCGALSGLGRVVPRGCCVDDR